MSGPRNAGMPVPKTTSPSSVTPAGDDRDPVVGPSIQRSTSTTQTENTFMPRSLLQSRYAFNMDAAASPDVEGEEMQDHSSEDLGMISRISTVQPTPSFPENVLETPYAHIPATPTLTSTPPKPPPPHPNISQQPKPQPPHQSPPPNPEAEAEQKEYIPHSLLQSRFARQPTQYCPICGDVVGDPVWLPCIHVFCDECIRPWLRNKSVCPTCRYKCTYREVFGVDRGFA